METSPRPFAVRVYTFFSSRPRLMLAGCVAAGILVLFLSLPKRPIAPVGQSTIPFGGPNTSLPASEGIRPQDANSKEFSGGVAMSVPPKIYAPSDYASAYREPQIAYSAELSVATKEFAHSRASVEEILERHHGYVSKLRMVGQPAGSVMSATLRVPSSEYRPALAELKGVGVLEHEEESADEITQQHSELEARLLNAQNEEQRLRQLLQNKAIVLGDPASLERQVAMLRGEIERMEAELYSTSSRTSFANVFISLREERVSPAETIGAKLRNAGLSGLNDALESISVILLFLASHGPLVGLWALLLYFPARYFWRRRPQLAFGESAAPKNSW